IGIHTGQAVPAARAYTGLAVHRAARICAAAHGGQVLVFQATQTIIDDEEEEEPGFTLLDLGERKLKDLDRPVRLFRLAAPGLDTPPAGGPLGRGGAAIVPAARGEGAAGGFAAAAARVVPRDLAAFTGREAELSRLLAALGGDARLVLVTGDAGVGKTRLVAEGLARAAAQGMPSASGACLPLAEELPLLPGAEALGGLAGPEC